MSAGPFESKLYLSDDTLPYFVRVQPETLDLDIGGVTNDEPTATATSNTFTLNVNPSKRANGIRNRSVTVRLTAGGTGKLQEYEEGTTHEIIWLDSATFSSIVKNSTGTYQGIACRVINTYSESRV